MYQYPLYPHKLCGAYGTKTLRHWIIVPNCPDTLALICMRHFGTTHFPICSRFSNNMCTEIRKSIVQHFVIECWHLVGEINIWQYVCAQLQAILYIKLPKLFYKVHSLSVNWCNICLIDLSKGGNKSQLIYIASASSDNVFNILIRHCNLSCIRNIKIELSKQLYHNNTLTLFSPLLKLGQWMWHADEYAQWRYTKTKTNTKN